MKPTTLAGAFAIGCLVNSHIVDSLIYAALFYFMAGQAVLAAIICWAIQRGDHLGGDT